MSSWLSGGLSQFSSLTDQISTFTKDVLSETTEEIEDPTAELQVARKKIQQLEEANAHYKTEWEKLQRHSEEVRERAETAECQIAAISQEYRKLIQERDAELRRLRTETASLREQQKMVRASAGGSAVESPLKELAGGGAFFSELVKVGDGGGGEGEWEVAKLEPVTVGEVGEREGEGEWEEFHDFGDVISSQGEINRLQMELTRVRAESRHWKALAKEKGHSTDTLTSVPVETEVSSLREQIEELQLCLQRERGQYQHQLARLEAAHGKETHDFPSTQSHSHETTNTAPFVSGVGEGGVSVSFQLREAMGEGPDGGRVSDESEREGVDELVRGSLSNALEEVSLEDDERERKREADGQGELKTALLQSELAHSRDRCAQLESELDQIGMELRQIQEEKERATENEHHLRTEIDALNTKLSALERERTELVSVREREVESLKSEIERFEAENSVLRVKGESVSVLETQLSHAQSVCDALTERVQSLQNEKTEADNRARELTVTLDNQKEATLVLQGKVDGLTRDSLHEREAYTRHAEQEKAQLESLIEQLKASISGQEEQIVTLQASHEELEREIGTHSLETTQLVAEIESRDKTVEKLREEISHKNCSDSAAVEELGKSKAVITELQESLRRVNYEIDDLKRRVNAEKEECLKTTPVESRAGHPNKRLMIKLNSVMGELTESKQERAQLEDALEERDSKLTELRLEKTQLELVVKQLQASTTEHEEQIATLEAELKKKIETHSLEITQLVAEIESRDKTLEKLREEISDKNLSDSAATEELERSKAVITELRESLRSVNFEMDDLKKRVNAEKEESLTATQKPRDRIAGQLQETLEKQRLQEVELSSVKEELAESKRERTQLEGVVEERDSKITELETEVSEVRERLAQMTVDRDATEAKLREKEVLVEHSQRNLQEVGQLLAAREEKIVMLQRERDSGREGASESVTAVTAERDQLVADLRLKQNEIERLHSELAASRETLESLNAKVQEITSDSERAVEMARLEVGSARTERDGLRERVGEVEEVAERRREELAAKEAECSKLMRQLDQLKAHLVQVEEQYTQDALQAEERERGERKRAEELQETLRHSSYLDQQESLQTKARVAALEEQLQVLAEQRDSAVLEMSSAREEAESSASALHNLQTVLEQFQREKSSELSEALKRSQLELANTLSELNTLRAHHTTTQGLHNTLHSTEEALEKLMREQGGRVDQNLVKNLVVGYVQAPDRKKAEVLNLIAKILDFSPSEIQQKAQSHRSGGGGGWLGALWGRQSAPSPVTTSPKLPLQGASLSQLFVSFLETESLPSSSSPPSSLPHPHPPSLDPPPPGRIPLPDPDRPSRATTGLSLIHPSIPPSRQPPFSFQSPSHPPYLQSANTATRTTSSNSYTDTRDLPGTGTAQGLPRSDPKPSLTATSLSLPGLPLSPVTPVSASQHTAPSAQPLTHTTTPSHPTITSLHPTTTPSHPTRPITPQSLATPPTDHIPANTHSGPVQLGTARSLPRTQRHHQPSILKDILSPSTS